MRTVLTAERLWDGSSLIDHPVVTIEDGLIDDVSDLGDLVNAHEGVHLGHEFGKFVAKTLREAAGNDDGLATPAGIAQFDRFEDGVHAFFLRGINERTGVHDDGIGLRGVIGDFDAAFHERAEHDLGIHEIFGAAERNQADAQRTGWTFFRFFFFNHEASEYLRNGSEAIL